MGRREIATKIREHDDQGCESCGSTCHLYADLLQAALVALEAPEAERVVLATVTSDPPNQAAIFGALMRNIDRVDAGEWRIIAERVMAGHDVVRPEIRAALDAADEAAANAAERVEEEK